MATSISTNDSIASVLCGLINSGTTSITISASDNYTPLVRLPDCVFLNATQLTRLAATRIIIEGTIEGSNLHDPFVRLPPLLAQLECYECIFVDPTVTAYVPNRFKSVSGLIPDWNTFFESHASLSAVNIGSSNLAGSLPAVLPNSITLFSVYSSALNGSIPSNFLSTIQQSATGPFSLTLSDNQLSGPFPGTMGLNSQSRVNLLTLNFAVNQLTGPLPNDLFNGNVLPQLTDVTLDLEINQIGGSIPDTFLSSFSLSTVKSFSLDLSSNRLTGTVASNILSNFNQSSLSIFSLSLENNQLSGDMARPYLFPWDNSPTLVSVIARLGSNLFTGGLPKRLFQETASLPSLNAIELNLSHNLLGDFLPVSLLSTVPPTTTANIFLQNTSISGTVPPGWLNLTSFGHSLTLNLSSNALTGSAFDVLIDFSGNPNTVQVLQLDASYNQLTGTIPKDFCAACTLAPALGAFELRLGGNQIEGPIAQEMLANPASLLLRYSFDFSSNQINGVLPASLMAPMNSSSAPNYQKLVFANNSITGPLPSAFYANTEFPAGTTITLDLSSNQIRQGLTSTFLSDIPSNIGSFNLLLDNNPLGGSFPDDFLMPIIHPPVAINRGYSLSVRNCGLSGSIPKDIFGEAKLAVLNLDHNAFSGTFRLDEILVNATSYSPTSSVFFFSASHNLLTSTVVLPNMGSNRLFLNLDLSYNSLGFISIDSSASSYLTRLDISNNNLLAGTIPYSLFSSGAPLTYLDAANTALSGTFLNLASSISVLLAHLNLSGTAIDFCSGTRTTYRTSSITECSLINSKAVTCQSFYPPVCFEGSTPSIGPGENGPSPCSNSTRPSPQFICIDGKWTTNTVVTAPTLVIPAGATETIVNADVESSVVVFNGLGSLTISGCANNLTQIIVTLTPEQLKGIGSTKINQTLITYATDTMSCQDLSQVSVTLDVKGSSCRKAKVTKATSNGQLSGLFSVDSSGCNTWWIILVSVICGIIVLLVVVAILLVVFVPSIRNKIRPYEKRGQSAHQSKAT